MKNTLAIILLFISTTSLANSWQSQGVSFYAEDKEFLNNKEHLLELSSQVAGELSRLSTQVQARFSISPTIQIVLKETATFNALYYPPGEYLPEASHTIVIHPSVVTSPHFSRLLAHEFFHAIHRIFHPHDPHWIKEGLAQLFEYEMFEAINYAHIAKALELFNFTHKEEFSIESYYPEKYGASFLFFHYMNQQCFSHDFINKYFSGHKAGTLGIDELLKKQKSSKSYCRSFHSLSKQFALARAINRYTGDNQKNDFYVFNFRARMLPSEALPQKEYQVSKFTQHNFPVNIKDQLYRFYTQTSGYPYSVEETSFNRINNLPPKSFIYVIRR